ncbi:hypothetical protein WUBG_05756 [Wuchereria bancrofti]|uniref:Uncharacterized protein n=1 Tax=Wuchereria bancrofti TaxID=6293 RepID=J9F1K6_WUCBA|nr:hypothetical protein WUBG_05756 [Wuchereria bancrofti]
MPQVVSSLSHLTRLLFSFALYHRHSTQRLFNALEMSVLPDLYSRTSVLPNASNNDQLSNYWEVRMPVIHDIHDRASPETSGNDPWIVVLNALREVAYNAYRTTARFIVL